MGAAGIPTVEGLLDSGASSHGRKALSEQTGISEQLILKWVNHSDLFRINGVAGEYAELLEASGVDSVPELAQRNHSNLQAKMAEVNEAKKLVRRVRFGGRGPELGDGGQGAAPSRQLLISVAPDPRSAGRELPAIRTRRALSIYLCPPGRCDQLEPALS